LRSTVLGSRGRSRASSGGRQPTAPSAIGAASLYQ
jgi:hypothetical protein